MRRNLLIHILSRPGARAVPGSVGEALSVLRDDVDMAGVIVGWPPDALGGIAQKPRIVEGRIEIRDGRISKNVDARLAGLHEGPKFNVASTP